VSTTEVDALIRAPPVLAGMPPNWPGVARASTPAFYAEHGSGMTLRKRRAPTATMRRSLSGARHHRANKLHAQQQVLAFPGADDAHELLELGPLEVEVEAAEAPTENLMEI